MNKILSVLLVEDDQSACAEIINAVGENESISLIGITNNSTKAVEYVKDYIPDAVILDLELHHGQGNGLLFLQEIKQLTLPQMPYILITTNNSSTVTYDYVRKMGADFIMSKHQEDYSAKSVIDFLVMMKDIIINRTQHIVAEAADNESPAQKYKHQKRRISAELDLVGISPKAIGYTYLIDAVILSINGQTGNICNAVSRQYGKTPASIERAMQNAINKAWRIEDIDTLLMYYTAKIVSSRGVPTVTEFICYYANKIKNEY